MAAIERAMEAMERIVEERTETQQIVQVMADQWRQLSVQWWQWSEQWRSEIRRSEQCKPWPISGGN